MSNKLNNNQKHLLFLIRKDKKEDGWTKVSEILWKFFDALPKELVQTLKLSVGGLAKLTEKGNIVMDWI